MKDFVNFLKSQKLSPKTIRNYASDVSQFLGWITKSRRHHANKRAAGAPELYSGESSTAFADIERVDFANYFTYLNSLNIPRSTLARHLASLRQFARFLNLDINLDNPPLPLVPTLLKNFRAHLTSARGRSSFGRKSRYKHKTVANYLSDIRHYLTWAEAQLNAK